MSRWFGLFWYVSGLFLSGCAVLPEYREQPVTTADVIRHLKCEIHRATLRPGNDWIDGWTVGLTFELVVTHLGGLDAENNIWQFPLNHGANFTIALTGGFSGQGMRTERVLFKYKIGDADANPGCDDDYSDRHALLGGELGIHDLFKRVALTMEAARIPKWQSLDYNLEFVVKRNAGVTPKFSVIPIGKEKNFTGNLKWTGSRNDTQGVKIALTPPDKKNVCSVTTPDGNPWPEGEPCPQAVYIVDVQDCRSLKEDKCKRASNICMWTTKGCARVKGTPMTMFRNGRLERRTVIGPSRAEEEKNTNAQILNTLNNLKIQN